MGLGLEILVVLLLIALNGLFSMSELALVSARRARLAVLERKGVAGAALARRLAEDPQLFLPTVQVGITLVAVLTGVFGGARIAVHVQDWLASIPVLEPVAEMLSLGLVVVVTTYLTMVLGELVPSISRHGSLQRSPGLHGRAHPSCGCSTDRPRRCCTCSACTARQGRR